MDPYVLRRRIAALHERAQRLEAEIVLACEQAASRKCRNGQLPADRSEWSAAAWDRYLAEAVRLNHHLGRRVSAIRDEIDALERLASDLLTA